jgi:hypothetical protein
LDLIEYWKKPSFLTRSGFTLQQKNFWNTRDHD